MIRGFVARSTITIKKLIVSTAPWLRPVILATQEAEIRRIQNQPRPQKAITKKAEWLKP
jgi:hypothetical protein